MYKYLFFSVVSKIFWCSNLKNNIVVMYVLACIIIQLNKSKLGKADPVVFL